MLDENEFLSPNGIRAVSKVHREHPYVLRIDGHEYGVTYEPGESSSYLFAATPTGVGRSGGPITTCLSSRYNDSTTIWVTTIRWNARPVRAVDDPGRGSAELSRRLTRTFLHDDSGCRPAHADQRRYAEDPTWRDLILFYEYFHGDTGAGLGGEPPDPWTGLVAKLLQQSGE